MKSWLVNTFQSFLFPKFWLQSPEKNLVGRSLEFRVDTKCLQSFSNKIDKQWQKKSFLSRVLWFSLVYLQPIHTCFSLKVNLGARFCKNHGACWLSNKKSTMLNPQFPPHSIVNEDRSQPSPGGANLDAHLGGWIVQIRRIIYLRKTWISNDMMYLSYSQLISIDIIFKRYYSQMIWISKIWFSNDILKESILFTQTDLSCLRFRVPTSQLISPANTEDMYPLGALHYFALQNANDFAFHWYLDGGYRYGTWMNWLCILRWLSCKTVWIYLPFSNERKL